MIPPQCFYVHVFQYVSNILTEGGGDTYIIQLSAGGHLNDPFDRDGGHLVGMALLEGHTTCAAIKELQLKFWPTYKVIMMVSKSQVFLR